MVVSWREVRGGMGMGIEICDINCGRVRMEWEEQKYGMEWGIRIRLKWKGIGMRSDGMGKQACS